MSQINESSDKRICYFFHFGLIVTGKTEREHLPKLFKSLMQTGICTFEVIHFIGQRSQITSEKRKILMIGKGQIIPTKDVTLGLLARRFLNEKVCQFVILLDDLEHSRQEHAQQIFNRYRLAFDTILTPPQKKRAAVHFLVNMLEAYYFADANAINTALDMEEKDYAGDVETIKHPKNRLKNIYEGFREIEDGGKILDYLDVAHVLSRPDACAWLRTLFAWCIKILTKHPQHESFSLDEKYQIQNGTLSPVTKIQLEDF